MSQEFDQNAIGSFLSATGLCTSNTDTFGPRICRFATNTCCLSLPPQHCGFSARIVRPSAEGPASLSQRKNASDYSTPKFQRQPRGYPRKRIYRLISARFFRKHQICGVEMSSKMLEESARCRLFSRSHGQSLSSPGCMPPHRPAWTCGVRIPLSAGVAAILLAFIRGRITFLLV